MKKVFFPGSFNPFTKGHEDILLRLLELADSVVIGIGFNIDKPAMKDEAEKNAEEIRRMIRRKGLEARVEVEVYEGLTAETAKALGADCMARGVRNSCDFEYENSLANLNRKLFGIETLLFPCDPELSYISSTAVRDLLRHGRKDLAEKLLP